MQLETRPWASRMTCRPSASRTTCGPSASSLDEAPGTRLRDLPAPVHERPSFMKKRARRLLRQAARLADASVLGERKLAEIAGNRDEA